MTAVCSKLILTREILPEIFEFVEEFDLKTQQEMLGVAIAKNPRILQLMKLYYEMTFTELGDVDYEMPGLNTPAFSNLYKHINELKLLSDKCPLPLEKKQHQFKIIASTISVEELMFLENMRSGTLEEMYPGINWEYLRLRCGVVPSVAPAKQVSLEDFA